MPTYKSALGVRAWAIEVLLAREANLPPNIDRVAGGRCQSPATDGEQPAPVHQSPKHQPRHVSGVGAMARFAVRAIS
jgi:hypothetical protein